MIAGRGVRRPPTLALGERPRPARVTSRRVAATIGSLMVDVVAYGTGTAAALDGVKVAGKTGTAELEDTRDPETGETLPPDPENTDAWFTAYAPAAKPRVAVAVMLVRAGAGGDHGRARGPGGARRRALGGSDVELEGVGLVALALDLELQRAVLGVLERQPEEQHRSRGRAELRDAAGLRDALLWGEPRGW